MPFSPTGYSTTWDCCSQQHAQQNASRSFVNYSAIIIWTRLRQTEVKTKRGGGRTKRRKRGPNQSLDWSLLLWHARTFSINPYISFATASCSVSDGQSNPMLGDARTHKELTCIRLVIEALNRHLGDLGSFPLQAGFPKHPSAGKLVSLNLCLNNEIRIGLLWIHACLGSWTFVWIVPNTKSIYISQSLMATQSLLVVKPRLVAAIFGLSCELLGHCLATHMDTACSNTMLTSHDVFKVQLWYWIEIHPSAIHSYIIHFEHVFQGISNKIYAIYCWNLDYHDWNK